MKKVVIYSTPTCHFCHMAKDFFNENGIQFTDHNVQEDLDMRKEMVEKSGQMGVPVIDIEGETVVGFNEEKIRGLLELN